MKRDLRSPLAHARDAWLASDVGRRCAEGGTYGQYLRNRLEAAFVAGWLAKEAVLRSVVPLPKKGRR